MAFEIRWGNGCGCLDLTVIAGNILRECSRIDLNIWQLFPGVLAHWMESLPRGEYGCCFCMSETFKFRQTTTPCTTLSSRNLETGAVTSTALQLHNFIIGISDTGFLDYKTVIKYVNWKQHNNSTPILLIWLELIYPTLKKKKKANAWLGNNPNINTNHNAMLISPRGCKHYRFVTMQIFS